MNDLELTNDELRQIVHYAETAQSDQSSDPKLLALALQVVALCMLRLQSGDPPLTGPGVDRWYDEIFGFDMRPIAARLDPAVQKLRAAKIIK
ncbi:hypothetical protein Pan241w_52710 [Gimesia alba]|uniref:Uncharacterized protein n=1 Tax=Gimesia alba TaxID=2527973 RepID=A0A517RMW1_9PLAN|nr:hypothetical protein [Gimesia alba]QDT45152.1 hypothetical protein Pan241w_52710 [Gimesia alba]